MGRHKLSKRTVFEPNGNIVYLLYWMCERMDVFWRRCNGEEYPWTEDKILTDNKFTNVYKVLDRGTQFELSNVLYNGEKYSSYDTLFRILVYKHFNLPSTWKIIEEGLGDITLDLGFDEIRLYMDDYIKMNPDIQVYSNAYVLTARFITRKKSPYYHFLGKNPTRYQMYFEIFQREIFDTDLCEKILDSGSLKEMYDLFMTVTGFGSFLTYQYIIDLNYSDLFKFDENSFTEAGIGTKRGIIRTFNFEGDKGQPDYEAVINWTRKNLESLIQHYYEVEGIDLEFEGIPGRLPTNVDVANIFCETDKYMGMIGLGEEITRKRTKDKFYPERLKKSINYMFPPYWNVDIYI